MPDIFISYSRKDSTHATRLAERLRADGIDVWIDQCGIAGAEQWATEIVEGIRACSTFILLISPNSIESENVLRELSLASEKRKRVLPVDIEPTILPSSFEYPLAGLQRVPFAEFDRIIHAHKYGVEKIVKKDERKSLMILPFEDLSPSGDNAWFADGIASELISALSNVKSIRVADNQATKEFKKYSGLLTTYAKEMNFRYFVQGDVRKFGDQIKISSRLIDIETGEHLWQDSMKGTMNDIFDIQEKVAEQVVVGLKLHLTAEEKKKLGTGGTENAEAYELYLKADEYFRRQTMEGFHLAIQLYAAAIKLDPGYANAYSSTAQALASLYQNYSRDPAQLEEGLRLIKESLRLKPERWAAYAPLSHILQLQGKLEEAEQIAKEYVHNAPEDFMSHFVLGFFYSETAEEVKSIPHYERSLELNPDNMITLFNLVLACSGSKQEKKRLYWAELAIPVFERHLKLFPENENMRVAHAVLLHHANRDDEARAVARRSDLLRNGHALYNIASLQCMLADYDVALTTFRKAVEAGFRNVPKLKLFLTEMDDGLGRLKGTPEYEEVWRIVEELSKP